MNKFFIVFFILSILNAQFFDDEIEQNPSLNLQLNDSLPKNMPFVKNILWSKNGLVRKLNIAPKSRLSELELRRNMMQLHQKSALINLGLMSYQYYLGYNMDKDYQNRSDLHRTLGYATFSIYMTSAGLSILSPPALKYDKGVSSMNIHRLLSIVHFSGMLLQPLLGYQTANSSCHSDYYYDLHKDVGNIVFATYLLSFLVTLI